MGHLNRNYPLRSCFYQQFTVFGGGEFISLPITHGKRWFGFENRIIRRFFNHQLVVSAVNRNTQFFSRLALPAGDEGFGDHIYIAIPKNTPSFL